MDRDNNLMEMRSKSINKLDDTNEKTFDDSEWHIHV